MRVDITHQHRGVGTIILERLIKRAKELGYKKVIIDATENQKVAQQLYEKEVSKSINEANMLIFRQYITHLIFKIIGTTAHLPTCKATLEVSTLGSMPLLFS